MPLSEEQLLFRRNFISASEAPTVVSLSPYRGGLHSIYLDKLGLAEPRVETPAMVMGNKLEPVALSCLAERRKLTLFSGETRKHAILDLGATPDALVFDRGEMVAVAEAKAPGLHAISRWGEDDDPDGVPDEVLIQVTVQMHVFRVPNAYVCALLGNEARTYEIPYNESLAHALATKCQAFWDAHVKPRIPPTADGSEASASLIRALFPRNRTKNYVEVGHDVVPLARAYFDAKADMAEAEEKAERAKQALQLLIKDAEGVVGPGFRAQWKTEGEGRVAWAEVAKALNPSPELVAAHMGQAPRVFRMKDTSKQKERKSA